ncbi:MAG: SHOCT domain-containing protein [Candidatus Thermoplasmatota archaeon]|nr:SHOCT domain-containing protein [Candidatus Thermoplasmatota archaeon]
MSEYIGSDIINEGEIPLMDIILDVVEELGWRVVDREDKWVSVTEKSRFDNYNPLRMDINVRAGQAGGTELTVHAINAGQGPVQDEYIRSQVIRFVDSVKMTAEGVSSGLNRREFIRTFSISTELGRLSALHDEGKLTEEEYRKAKEKVING